MNYKGFICIVLLALLYNRCSKEKQTIDVNSIVFKDGQNLLLGSSGNVADQWVSQNFTAAEMAMFNELDTTNLTGTSTPSQIILTAAFPNPFRNYIIIASQCDPVYTGTIVVKYVVVNKFFDPIIKNSLRINYTQSYSPFEVANLSKGNYRIYVTYSAINNEHFFKFWGDIQSN